MVLTAFSIYRPGQGKHPDELTSLHNLHTYRGHHNYLLDGVLCYGSVRRYVQKVPFDVLSIGGYGDTDQHTVGPDMWLQTKQSALLDVWYQLGKPAPEYERYHQPFLWLADLSKHFVDFLDNHDNVSLQDFKTEFFSWINDHHGQDASFQAWRAQYPGRDFRRAIAAYAGFLWNQARDLSDTSFDKHPLSVEAHSLELNRVRPQICVETSTIVTPFVYECFKHISWARFLEPRKPYAKVLEASYGTERALKPTFKIGLTRNGREHQTPQPPEQIEVGDVVGVSKDNKTAWKGHADMWFAYVQALRCDRKGQTVLDVLWLYAPSDTTCSTGRYPFKNELFFSDNCNCEDDTLRLSEVICKVSVAFFSHPQETATEYFVRQKYTYEETFVTLKNPDFVCVHRSASAKSEIEELMEDYRVGDSVLVLGLEDEHDHETLEPVEIVAFSDGIQVRRLLRRNRDFELEHRDARPNELVYTDDILTIPASAVERRCHVRFYTVEELNNSQIPAPYNRDGTADAYYITYRQTDTKTLEPLRLPLATTLRQGFDPQALPVRPVMTGLDLFCGGGNFGRGLEEGGSVSNKWAVDWDITAMHAYSANLRETASGVTQLYNGSVNDYLAQSMDGSSAKEIAQVGEVDFISAGSPCQGYSVANKARGSDNSLKQCSMVAAVAAFVDFYRPKYALLENVTSMAKQGAQDPDDNIFALMLCTLVGMGYQVRPLHLDAWSFGAPQSRSRLFISIAAPGLELPPHPAPSHSHPPNMKQRSLGKAANGIGFGRRQFGATPYKYVTASEATSDLSSIGDSRVSVCIPYPDHRTSRVESTHTRVLISHIPRFPYGETFMTAYRRGCMSKPQVDMYPLQNGVRGSDDATTWRRLRPDGLFPTLTTGIRPQDGRCGATLHWDEHRLMTVMEARRAQGFPDEEVIIGTPAQQWKIIGNSVARPVAVALGMSLREAWLANKPDELPLDDIYRTRTTNASSQQEPLPRETTLLKSSPAPDTTKQQPQIKVIDLTSDDEIVQFGRRSLSNIEVRIPNRRISALELSAPLSAPAPTRTTLTRQVTHSETRITRTITTTRQYTADPDTTPAALQARSTPAQKPGQRSVVQRLANGYRALFDGKSGDGNLDPKDSEGRSLVEISD